MQHYHALPSCDQPSTSVIVNQAVQLLGLAGGDLAPRRAVILLAEARWNYAAAAQAALDEVAAAREDSLSGSEEGGDIEGTEEEVSDEAGSEVSQSNISNLKHVIAFVMLTHDVFLGSKRSGFRVQNAPPESRNRSGGG